MTVRAMRYVGWLLRVNRRLGYDEALRSGREFARVFRCDTARPLAPSQVTRWESGDLAVGRATIRRYECLLGLSAESLVTMNDAVLRSECIGAAKRTEGWIDSDDDRDRLHELLAHARTDNAMTGVRWSQLVDLIMARPDLELHPPHLWRGIANRLLSELVIAADRGWFQRQEAMSHLLEHPAARRHAVAACIALADELSSPAIIEPLSLLDVTAHPDANRYVLLQIERPNNDRALYGALLAAVRKVRQGHFRDAEWPRLIRSINALMTDSALDQTLLPLVVDVARALAHHLPDAVSLRHGLPSTLLAHQIWASQRISEPAVSQAESRRIAMLAQSQFLTETHDVDETLAMLVEESLFVPNPDRRLVASTLIASTPYREPVAHALLAQITKDLAGRNQIYPLAAALRTLTQLNVDIHRSLVHDILVRPGFGAGMRHAAAWATPFCAGQHPEPAWRSIVATQLKEWKRAPSDLGEATLQGIAYGIGTDGHRRLLAEIHDDLHMPSTARNTASWALHTQLSRE
jgi:hypothetical protein